MQWSIVYLVAIATACNASALPSSRHGNGMQLLESIQNVARALSSHPSSITINNNDVVSVETAPKKEKGHLPGSNLNICEEHCPKWCQKVTGAINNFTHCHYLCGNLCDKEVAVNNPFIGNSRYEVVPSIFSFSRYDTNNDKLITIEEFAAVEGISLGEALDLFTFVDLNIDGFIDEDEFKGGPFIFTVQMAAELSSMAMLTKTPAPPTTSGKRQTH